MTILTSYRIFIMLFGHTGLSNNKNQN